MRWPSVTPAGMRTFTWRGRCSTPVPRQLPQGVSIFMPWPPQVGHVWLKLNMPWLSLTTPRPPHVGQMTGDVPGAAPLPWHTEQVRVARDVDLGRDALHGVDEVQVQFRREVAAALGTGTRAWGRRRGAPAVEQIAEQVAEVVDAEVAAEAAAAATTAAAEHVADRAEPTDLVVLLALVGVAEHVVGRARFP